MKLDDAQHEKDSVKNKPASLLVPLRKALWGCSRHGAVDRELAIPKRACHSALIALSS